MDEYITLFIIVMLLFIGSILLYSYDTLTMIITSFIVICTACFITIYVY